MKHTAAQRAWTSVGIIAALTAGCGDDTSSDTATTGVPTTSDGTDTGDSTTGDSTTSDSTSGSTSDSTSGSTSDSTTSDTTTTDSSTTDPSTGTSDGTSGSTGSTGGSTGGGIQPIECPAHDLGDVVPGSWSDQTDDQTNELSGSCGGAGAPDMAFTFTAPATGPYSFDTFGSAYDTVLYILDGDCDGPELTDVDGGAACDDDSLGGGDSIVSVNLTQGQTVIAVVDGFGLFGDDFALHVSSGQLSCPRNDLGSTVPNTISDSSLLAEDEYDASCGGGTSGDFSYTFTAPSTGDFIFDTLGSDYNTVLSVLDGNCPDPSLPPTELECNDNASSGVTASVVTASLTNGQTVTVVVEGSFGSSGDLQLNVGELGGTCPDQDLGTAAIPVNQSGSTAAAQNTKVGDCGGYTSADETYLWTAPADGTYIFDTEGSDFDTVLYVTDVDCNGTELACNNDVGGNDTWSQLAVDLTSGQTVAITVDGAGDSGNYDLNITQLECPGPELSGALPLTENGTTAGLVNNLYGGCGADGAPEQTFLWTAPADGEFVFDTFGSSFDTVLYLLDGNTCNSDVLVCDDDENGLQSQVTATLTTGQEIIIVVDGYSSNQGAFTLNIAQN